MKRIKPYLYTGLVCFIILLVVSMFKGIFPFGDNSFIWGDMHDQITAFYYDFYDAVYGSKSLLIDFSSSGGVNFLGILAYYILSPFSLLVLIVPRNLIYLMVSIIIELKVVMCSITCLYFLRETFKNVPLPLNCLLAIIYAFSGYALVMYQITPWIDAMYMLPLVALGLRKVLDLEKPHLYIVTLTLSLIFSFYVSIMEIIFIFLISFIYLLVYKKEKEDRKKAILSLGIATGLSLLISLFIVIPSYMQINESSRFTFSIKTLLNSKLGPISDKLSLIAFGGLLYAAIISLYLKFKEHKQFLTFYTPALLIMFVPLIIEPVNKVLHFGSYVCFPYRFGFVLMFLLVLGAGYYFDNFKEKKTETILINRIASVILVGLASFFIVKFTYRYYDRLQAAIYKLSISYDSKLIIILLVTTLVSFLISWLVLTLNKNLSIFTVLTLAVLAISHIGINTYTYFGNDLNQELLTDEYKLLSDISKDYPDGEYYRVKTELDQFMANSGPVMKYHSLDHFTSLTSKSTLESLKKMGYGSYWVKTYSRGGNLFLDAVFANKYLLTENYIRNPYFEIVKNYKDAKLYKLKRDLPYGVIISKNDTIFDKNNSFEISNSLYRNITGKEEDLFMIDSKVSLENIRSQVLENGLIEYSIIDSDYHAYIEKDVIITGKKNLYLEINHTLKNDDNTHIDHAFSLYVNGELVKDNAFTQPNNGTMNLGIFENERVNIKLELKDTAVLKDITAGIMDVYKYEEFIGTYNSNNDINYDRNEVTVKVKGEKGKILLLPIAYNEGYKATNNGKKVEVLKLYDNFVGIKLNDGDNNITLKYMPKGLTPTIIISGVAIILTFVLLFTGLYYKILDIKILKDIAYNVYLFLYLAMILLVYVMLTLCFMLSYLLKI